MSIDPRISTAFERDNGFPLAPHLLVFARMGSHSHGTYLPPEEPDGVDDVDLVGFLVPPVEYHLGLPRWQHWRLQFEELDIIVYSLDKAVRLLLKSNPNILGVLWLREEDYVHRHPLFDSLMRERAIFSSQIAAEAFVGYAYDQLKRMEAFDRHRMAEYEALSAQIGPQELLSEVLEADAAKLQHIATSQGLPADLLQRFRKLHREHFSGYMGKKRKAMVRRHQYDVKNAAHLIRLLRMGSEFLRTGVLEVFRTTDAEELRRIKRGGWSLEQVKAEAKPLFAGITAARLHSPLPPQPDTEAANRLLMRLQCEMLHLGPAWESPTDRAVSPPAVVPRE